MTFNELLPVVIVAQEPAQPLLERLDPPRRAMVMMAIFGLVILGLALIAAVMMGGRWVRRMARHQPGARSSVRNSSRSLATQRVPEPAPNPAVEGGTSSTVQIDTASRETRIEPRDS
jgi:hypothetical protein